MIKSHSSICPNLFLTESFHPSSSSLTGDFAPFSKAAEQPPLNGQTELNPFPFSWPPAEARLSAQCGSFLLHKYPSSWSLLRFYFAAHYSTLLLLCCWPLQGGCNIKGLKAGLCHQWVSEVLPTLKCPQSALQSQCSKWSLHSSLCHRKTAFQALFFFFTWTMCELNEELPVSYFLPL